ncbi:2-oxo acid dehydrogenase subunit E2 [Cryobacterium melibiosiphilum]|uniref:Dihydrolipoamide acetyltransferase component of pyruvate dehydrogenase complex n=1 Tax=Cryobacterium melibiosiphilum TaxID=995039 RepID=A0A3A5MB73_9MICO|nr:dihydrolipoamide acetyltransferase family protein [Cryobacterium melibiosiphilum]RJT87360.1 2-oxo acid dehydrogenase subunit E2 [Cryobacterium melibiosiphilum]
MPEVIMPRLSDTMEEGELSRWLKNVGDTIHKGDVLAEIETDKATMDLESFDDGILEQLLVPAGALVPIGQAVAVIGDGTHIVEADAPAAPAAEAPAAEAPAKIAPATKKAAEAPATPAAPEAVPAAAAPVAPKDLRTSPLARKIAKEHNIDIATLTGTGPQGRIARADVEARITELEAGTAAEPAAPAASVVAPAAPAAAVITPGADDEVVAISRIRKVTARRLTESQAVPHFFLTSVVDVERLVAFRAEVNVSLAALGQKVSINDLFVRAAAVTLRQHPEVNASWGGDAILRHPHVNVGIAVATDDGLLVPVIRDTDTKSLATIAGESVALAGKARTGSLGLADMTGGTFSISNLGMFGIDSFTAVLNPPEAAILAIGAATDVPVIRDGVLVAVPKVKITLTVDHRVLDGAVAAGFLRDLTKLLEEPLRIVI